jgi:hypothetical protein
LGGLTSNKLITLGIYYPGQTQQFGADLQIFPMRRFNIDFKPNLAALQESIGSGRQEHPAVFPHKREGG